MCMCMDHLLVLPWMTHWQLYVCGVTSWWTGHALALEHSYNNLPCTKTDEAQQFSTVCGCGGVTGIGESCWVSSSVEVGCRRLKMFSSWWFSSSKPLMQQFSCSTCCSSAEILWTSASQLSAHWLLVWHSYMQGREEGESLLIYYILMRSIVQINQDACLWHNSHALAVTACKVFVAITCMEECVNTLSYSRSLWASKFISFSCRMVISCELTCC